MNKLIFLHQQPQKWAAHALYPWAAPTLIHCTCFSPSLGPQIWLAQDDHQPFGKSPHPGSGAAHHLARGCHQGCRPSDLASTSESFRKATGLCCWPSVQGGADFLSCSESVTVHCGAFPTGEISCPDWGLTACLRHLQ